MRKSKNKSKENKPMDMELLEKQLLPKNENLIKIKHKRSPYKHRKPKNNIVEKESIPAQVLTFAPLDPFHNCNDFIRFYHKYIKSLNIYAEFWGFNSEREIATDILDILIVNKRNNNITFLKSWIKYFVLVYLKGDNIKNKNKTSLRAFKDTFVLYNTKYMGD